MPAPLKQKAVKAEATKKKGRANSIDEHVGVQLRQRRALAGLDRPAALPPASLPGFP